jgi:hypothetical protein
MMPHRSPSATVKVMFLNSSVAPNERPTFETESRVTRSWTRAGKRPNGELLLREGYHARARGHVQGVRSRGPFKGSEILIAIKISDPLNRIGLNALSPNYPRIIMIGLNALSPNSPA